MTSWGGCEVLTQPSPAGELGGRGDNARANYQPLRGDRRRPELERRMAPDPPCGHGKGPRQPGIASNAWQRRVLLARSRRSSGWCGPPPHHSGDAASASSPSTAATQDGARYRSRDRAQSAAGSRAAPAIDVRRSEAAVNTSSRRESEPRNDGPSNPGADRRAWAKGALRSPATPRLLLRHALRRLGLARRRAGFGRTPGVLSVGTRLRRDSVAPVAKQKGWVSVARRPIRKPSTGRPAVCGSRSGRPGRAAVRGRRPCPARSCGSR